MLDALFDYPAQYVFAVRHGFDVTYSCLSRFLAGDGIPFNQTTSLNIETYLREWIANNESTKDFYDRNRDRCIMVRYEDFVERPSHYGRRIFEFLGEEWDDGVLERLGAQSLAGMGDNKINSLGGKIVRSESKWTSGRRD
jgi:Sulfotransferase family